MLAGEAIGGGRGEHAQVPRDPHALPRADPAALHGHERHRKRRLHGLAAPDLMRNSRSSQFHEFTGGLTSKVYSR